jgi:hypothetical protein
MKTILQILQVLGVLASVYEFYMGRIEMSILFLVWSFYFAYLSDQYK